MSTPIHLVDVLPPGAICHPTGYERLAAILRGRAELRAARARREHLRCLTISTCYSSYGQPSTSRR